ncbi:hypothetical protein JSQ84_01270 [Limosilactobacillus reuteri]|uniref:hypothetical protein n=1 Tax=Limosilactobacillus reuteri TaxID=1598 RepID=UPI001C2BF355|nr:hypothetical protein [Limosilactobacillus reuteri]MBV0920989.1 hypothetical protein [Limosilactobacillus reuteri]
MSTEVKVLSTSTRTNLEVLKHHMKKLGFKYYEARNEWVTFGTQLMIDEKRVSPFDNIAISIDFRYLHVDISDFSLIGNLPEAEQAILDFYEAEGITDED